MDDIRKCSTDRQSPITGAAVYAMNYKGIEWLVLTQSKDKQYESYTNH